MLVGLCPEKSDMQQGLIVMFAIVQRCLVFFQRQKTPFLSAAGQRDNTRK